MCLRVKWDVHLPSTVHAHNIKTLHQSIFQSMVRKRRRVLLNVSNIEGRVKSTYMRRIEIEKWGVLMHARKSYVWTFKWCWVHLPHANSARIGIEK